MSEGDRCSFVVISDWLLDATADEIAAILDNPMSLTNWWSPVFMRGEELSPGDENRNGFTARFHTKGLLPHTFQFRARLERPDRPDSLRVVTWGDFDGHCDIRFQDDADGARVNLNWQVTVYHPYIRGLIRLFKPVFTANHRWAMRRGREGLQAEIWRRRGVEPVFHPRYLKPSFPHNLPSVQNKFAWTRDSINWARR